MWYKSRGSTITIENSHRDTYERWRNLTLFFCIYAVLFAVCLFLAGYIVVNNNSDKIMSVVAMHYFRQNNIPKALSMAEKAFQAGSGNTKLRKIYVDTLIKTPDDVNAQEKLLAFLDIPVEDGIKTQVQYFFNDLKVDIYREYPANYIQNAVINNKIISWSNVNISYNIEDTDGVPDYYYEEIEQAFLDIEEALEHKIIFSHEQQTPNIIIKFNNKKPSKSQDKYIIAYTKPIIITNVLKNMFINFYVKNSAEENFTKNQIYNTAMHEIIHAMGFMGHCKNKNNMMYLAKDSEEFINDVRQELNEADINTIKLLYNIKPDITNENTTNNSRQYKYIPFVVLGNNFDMSKEKQKEAKYYIKKVPGLINGYIDLAESFVSSKNYANAVKSLDRALNVAKNNEEKLMVYYNLGVTYFEMNNYDTAILYLNKAKDIRDSEDIHYLLAESYAQNTNTEKAVAEYKYLINRSPDNQEYVIALTNIYIQNKKYFDAYKILKQFFKRHPEERKNQRFEPYGIIRILAGL